MKKKIAFVLMFIAGLFALVNGQTREVPYTLEDRDRTIQMKAEVASLRNEMTSLRNEINAKFETVHERLNSMQQQINDLKTMFYWGFGILITMMLAMFAYIVWDRRTALFPLQEKTNLLSEKYITILNIMREFSKDNPRLADILRTQGLM